MPAYSSTSLTEYKIETATFLTLLFFVFLASSSFAQTPEQDFMSDRLGESDSMRQVQRTIPPQKNQKLDAEKATTFRPSLVMPSIENTSFEDGDGDNHPDGWMPIGQPIFIEENGNSYVRATNRNFYELSIFRTIEDQHVSFTPRVRGRLGIEVAGLFSLQNFGFENYFQRSRAFLNNTDWRTVFYSLDLLETPENLLFLDIAGADQIIWVDYDDFDAVDTNVFDGEFEGDGDPNAPDDFPVRRWDFDQAVIVESTSFSSTTTHVLSLESGESASQIVAGLDGTHDYFINFKARSDEPSELLVIEEFLTSLGDVLTSKSYGIIQTGITTETFTKTIKSDRRRGTQASRIVISNVGNSNIEIDDFSRGYVSIFPTPFNPGDQVLDEDLEVLFAWPRNTFDVQAKIIDSEQSVQFDLSMEEIAGATRFSFNPNATVPSGTWNLELELGKVNRDGDLSSVTLTLPFEVTEPENLLFPDQYVSDKFERGAWTWLIGLPTESNELRSRLEKIKEDHYSFAVVFAETDKWPLITEICEDINLPFVAGDYAIMNEAKSPPAANEIISAETYRQHIRDTLGPAIGSDQLIGIYIIDEPLDPFDDVRTERNSRNIASTPDFPDPFFIVAALATDTALIERLRPPAYWTDTYPTFRGGGEDLNNGLFFLAERLRIDKEVADENGLPYYLVAQSFTSPDSSILGPRSMIEASVGLALLHAIDGIITFTHFTIGPLDGVRDENLDVVPNADQWIVELGRMEALESELANRELEAQPVIGGTFSWSIAQTPNDARHLNIVSMTPRQKSTARLIFSEFDLELRDIETDEIFIVQNTFVDIEFEPGQWRIFEISSPATALSSISSILTLREQSDFDLSLLTTVDLGRSINDSVLDPITGNYFAAGPNNVTQLSSDLSSQTNLEVSADYIEQIGSTLYLGSQNFGLSEYDLNTQELNTLTFAITGNVRNLAVTDRYSWHTMNYLGVSVFDLGTEAKAEFIDRAPVFSQSRALEVSASLPDSVLVTDERSGVWLYDLQEGELVPSQLAGIRRAIELQLNPSEDRLAVAALREGVAVYNVDYTTKGNIPVTLTKIFRSDMTGEKVEHVNWIDDNYFVATEWDGDSLFYFVHESTAVFLGRHASSIRDGSIADVQIDNSTMTQFYRDGRILQVNITPVLNAEVPDPAYSNWLIF